MTDIKFRFAGSEDSRDLFDWRNDEVTRQMSRNTDPVPWESHTTWYENALADPKRKILIAETPEGKVGMVRFDYQEEEGSAEININLNPEFRGKRLAQPVLDGACDFAHSELKLSRIYAEIRTINIASIKIFERAGFEYLPQETEGIIRMELLGN